MMFCKCRRRKDGDGREILEEGGASNGEEGGARCDLLWLRSKKGERG